MFYMIYMSIYAGNYFKLFYIIQFSDRAQERWLLF